MTADKRTDTETMKDLEHAIPTTTAEEEEEMKDAGYAQEIQQDDDDDADETSRSKKGEDSVPSSSFPGVRQRSIVFSFLIILVGVCASAAFLAVGLRGAENDQRDQFARHSTTVVDSIRNTFVKYETAGLFVHTSCRNRDISREHFRELYETLISTGLEFQVTSFNPNITHDERPAMEAAAAEFFRENYPEIEYVGVRGLEPDGDGLGLSVQNRSEQPYYFPVHFLEPVEGNEAAIGFDLYSSTPRRMTIQRIMETWKPAVTARLALVQESVSGTYGVILMHPGTPLSTNPDDQPRDFSSMVVRIPDLIEAAARNQESPSIVYIYDSTDSSTAPEFLGGATTRPASGLPKAVIPMSEKYFETMMDSTASQRRVISEIDIATREWTVVIVALDGTYEAKTIIIGFCGAIILLACILLAYWLHANSKRNAKMSLIRSTAEAEKAKLILDSMAKTAKAERDLNDFVSHEIRNPLAAALSATHFVSAEIADEQASLTGSRRSAVQEDLNIVHSSLQFINDLTRAMLDTAKASSNQLTLQMAATDILQDVLTPVSAMLYRRGQIYTVSTHCSSGLIVVTDRLRLKQMVMNLARNAAKFVETGFIRLGASVVDGKVQIYVEDSGPGIPDDKHIELFTKYQKSLDSLNQGTGIGLSLCKNLAELLNATLTLDREYDSGIPGSPGARFVIQLQQTPKSPEEIEPSEATNGNGAQIGLTESETPLPQRLKVLFVDDDPILRKLFRRIVTKCFSEWEVLEASNGETAVQWNQQGQEFDLIFVDQYMASMEKQLLGTETVRALRSHGVKSVICGLSANDLEVPFLQAGADAFWLKPFPSRPEILKSELAMLFSRPV